MLRLAIIARNPALTSAITSFGMILLALMAVMIVGLWVVVARGRARRDARDFDESASDPGLEALRHERLVVTPSRAPGDPHADVEAQLERTEASEPTDH
jgi:hypothetical protein